MDAPLLPAWVPDRFRPQRLLGEGGFGRVVLATDVELDRSVAIKVLHDKIVDSTILERFAREARVTASLEHPNLVRLFDARIDDRGWAYIVYEFVPGRTLAEAFEDEGPLAVGAARALVGPLASALDVLHGAGVIHRDLKPENILLRDGEDPVLCDLGIALVADGRATITGTGLVIGTPAYLAPEVWFGERATPASDQFSLAATLAMVVTGDPVYGTGEPRRIVEFLRTGREVSLRLPGEGAGGSFERALRRALRRDPAARFAGMAEFRAAVVSRRVPSPDPTRRAMPAALPVARDLAPTISAAPGDEGSKRQRRGSLVLASLGLALAIGLGAGLLTGLRSRPEPSGNDPPPRQHPGEVGEAPPPEAPARAPIQAFADALGLQGRTPAPLVLQAILQDEVDARKSGVRVLPILESEVRSWLDEHPSSTPARALRRRDRWRQWDKDDGPSKTARRAEMEEDCERTAGTRPEDYWAATAEVECLKFRTGQRFGMNLRNNIPEGFDDDVAALDQALRREDPGLRLARAELWGELGQRYLGHHPHFVALEFSELLLAPLIRDEAALPPELRLFAYRLARQNAYELGDARRYAALHRLRSAWALRALEDPQLRDYWEGLLGGATYPVQPLGELAGLIRSGAPMLRSDLPLVAFHSAGSLPLPRDLPGGAARPADLTAPIVAPPRREPPPLELAPGATAAEYRETRDRALLEGRSVTTGDGGWVPRVLAPACAGEARDLCRDALAWPGLARELANLEPGPGPARVLELLRDADLRARRLFTHREVLRRRFQGEAAEGTFLRSRLELAHGGAEGATWVLALLRDHLARLGPPWTFDEVDLGRRLALLLAEAGPGEARSWAAAESIRLTIRAVEGALALDEVDRPSAFELRQAVADASRLAPDAAAEFGPAFPEASFPDPLGDPGPRLARLRERLTRP